MSIDPYVLKVKPEDFNVVESNYYPDRGVNPFSEEYDVLGVDVVGHQKTRLSIWINECLHRRIPDKTQREEFKHALSYCEKVFQVTREDIELFKQMIDVPWRKSQVYESRIDFYDGYVEDYKVYIKVRLALRAGYIVFIQWL